MEGPPTFTKRTFLLSAITAADKARIKGIREAVQQCANEIDNLTEQSDPDISRLIATADLLTQAENTAIHAILLKYAK